MPTNRTAEGELKGSYFFSLRVVWDQEEESKEEERGREQKEEKE
jgi:hypothetical protein